MGQFFSIFVKWHWQTLRARLVESTKTLRYPRPSTNATADHEERSDDGGSMAEEGTVHRGNGIVDLAGHQRGRTITNDALARQLDHAALIIR